MGRYLEAASRVGCRIRHVFLTHVHGTVRVGGQRRHLRGVDLRRSRREGGLRGTLTLFDGTLPAVDPEEASQRAIDAGLVGNMSSEFDHKWYFATSSGERALRRILRRLDPAAHVSSPEGGST